MTTATRLLLLLTVAIAASASEAGAQLHVLFIGNSLTYTNDLPGMVAALAKAGGQAEVVHDQWTPGGRSLKDQWSDKKTRALDKITGAQWDYVVLQDYSLQPLKAPEDMVTYGTLFAQAVDKQGARPVWYMTWAHKDQQDQQPAYTKAYTDLCTATHGILAPAGSAWDAFHTTHPAVMLYGDMKHPNATGTYLAACVFYATFFHTSPVGLPGEPAKLDAAQAKPIQEAAWAAVQAVPAALAIPVAKK